MLAFKRDLLSHRFEHNFGTAADPMQTWQGEEHAHTVLLPIIAAEDHPPYDPYTCFDTLASTRNELSLKPALQVFIDGPPGCQVARACFQPRGVRQQGNSVIVAVARGKPLRLA